VRQAWAWPHLSTNAAARRDPALVDAVTHEAAGFDVSSPCRWRYSPLPTKWSNVCFLCRFSDAPRLHNRQARLDLSVKVPAIIVLVQLGQGFGIKLVENIA
jgi:hypothetical protein